MIVAQIVREFLGVSAVAAACTKKNSVWAIGLSGSQVAQPQRVRSSHIAAGAFVT